MTAAYGGGASGDAPRHRARRAPAPRGSGGPDRALRRRALLAGLPAAAGCLAAAGPPPDPPYPSQPVTLVAPFSAGGSADTAARLLAARAPRHLPNKEAAITVENRPGASGAIGTNSVARAVPDGFTLLLARTASSAILPAIDPRTPYAWDEFTMLGLLYETPFVVCVRADAPWRGLGDLLGALREAPGRLSFATSGPATILDLGVRQLFVSSGLPLDAGTALPFAGGAEAVAAVVSGQAHFVGSSVTDAIAALSARSVRALVVGGDVRHALFPDVPTSKEAGVEGLGAIMGWSGLFGPASLPADAVEAWVQAIASLGSDRAWVEATRRGGSVPRLLSPNATRSFLQAQVALYGELGRRLGLV